MVRPPRLILGFACCFLISNVCLAQQSFPAWFDRIQFFSELPAGFYLPSPPNTAAAAAAPFTGNPWGFFMPTNSDPSVEAREIAAWHALGRIYMPSTSLWSLPARNPFPNAAGARCVDVYGNPVSRPNDNTPQYSISNASVQAYHKANIQRAIDAGSDGFHFDDVGTGPNSVSWDGDKAGCFDTATITAFRAYLVRKYSTSDLNLFGITVPSTFDYGQWIVQKGIQKTWNQRPLAGLALEFYLFRFAAEKAFLGQMADFIHQYALQKYARTATLSVNTNFGYFSHPYFDVADYFLNESYTFSNDGLPPFANVDVKSYKGVRQWPIVALPEPLHTSGTLPKSTTNMIRLAIADIYASGGTISFAGEFSEWLPSKAISIDPSVLKTYAQFILATPALFENLRFSPQVAVLDSTASRMASVYALAPAAGLGNSYPSDSHYYGTARLLIDGNVQYDSVLAPDATLSALPSFTLAALQKYKVLVLANTLVLDNAQANSILDYVRGGGVVIATGLIGTHEPGGTLASRPDLTRLQSAEGATAYGAGLFIHTNQNLGAQYQSADVTGAGAAKSALLQTFQKLISPYITPDVVTSPVTEAYRAGGATAFLYRNPANALILHLVNYDYDPYSDTYAPKDNVRVTLRVGSQFVEEVILRSPDLSGAQSLAFTRSGDFITFTVPRLLAWDVLYLQQNTAAPVIQSVTPSNSIGAVGGSTLHFSVQAQDSDGNPLTYTWSVNGQVISGVFGPSYALGLPLTASGIYTVGVMITDGARTTRTSWDIDVAAYRPPRVLFDETHDEYNTIDAARASQLNPDHPGWVLFGVLAKAMEPSYRVSRLASGTITPEVLAGADVLVLAAPRAALSSTENQAIANFVQAGGALIFLGDGGLSTTINTLLGLWGIQFDPTLIESQQNTCSGCASNFYLSSLTNHPAVAPEDSFWANYGGSLTVSQGAVALGLTSAAEWRSTSGQATQQSGETNGPFVMIAAAQAALGRIFVVSDNSFHDESLQSSVGSGNLKLFLSSLAWLSAPVNTTPAAPSTTIPTISSVVNAASFTGTVAPGAWATIFGRNLANSPVSGQGWSATDINGVLLPTSLAGTSVRIDGRAAAVAFVSPSQLNVQAPDYTADGKVSVEVDTPYGRATGTANVQPLAPAIFPVAVGNVTYAAAVGLDGVLIAPPDQIPGARLARSEESLQLFGTGFGETTIHQPAGQLVNPTALANAVTGTICGQPVAVSFAGLVSPGLDQINLTLPTLPPGNCPVQLSVGGVGTQSGIVIPIGQ